MHDRSTVTILIIPTPKKIMFPGIDNLLLTYYLL